MLKTEKKIKKPSRSGLIKKLDTEFSLFIRKRYAKNNIAVCYTCGKQDEVKNLQCGHFQSRKHYSTRWDELNCQVQCYACNVMRYGEQYKFGLYLNAQFGEDTATSLMIKSKSTLKLKDFEIIDMIEKYKNYNSSLI
jgi:hypothetical protein